jgi:hypothetical protein
MLVRLSTCKRFLQLNCFYVTIKDGTLKIYETLDSLTCLLALLSEAVKFFNVTHNLHVYTDLGLNRVHYTQIILLTNTVCVHEELFFVLPQRSNSFLLAC